MKTRLISLLLIVFVLFSSCSVQTDFDIFDLCKRYNTLVGEKVLLTESFLSDNEKMLYSFLTVGDSRLLISVETNGKSVIEKLSVTVEKGQYSESDRQRIINCITLLFSAFNYGKTDEATENLSLLGFDRDFEPFSELYKSETVEKTEYTLYSNGFSFTLSAQKNLDG